MAGKKGRGKKLYYDLSNYIPSLQDGVLIVIVNRAKDINDIPIANLEPIRMGLPMFVWRSSCFLRMTFLPVISN
jgi:hypothetical protein